MEKLMDRNFIKKIALIILIILSFNFIVPTYSNAAIMESLLSKPLATLVMAMLNSVNLRLSLMFATDTMIQDVKAKGGTLFNEVIERKDDGKDDADNFLENLSDDWDNLIGVFAAMVMSPDKIFTNKVQIANANIFSESYNKDNEIGVTDVNIFNHLLKSLKETIAGIYALLRNLAVVILLCMLIYAGIRTILASNSANEKAKWQVYIVDWVKALALVMFIHLIMIGIFQIIDLITNSLTKTFNNKSIGEMIMLNFSKESIFSITGVWVYVIMYAYLTYMNFVFLISYFKRLVYLMNLIVIAPIVAVLYPFGKRGHQIFAKWFEEFIAAVTIQPFHLVIYTVLFLVPIKLMTDSSLTSKLGIIGNITPVSVQIYCLICIGMIRPIEKFMRSIFKFGGTVMDNVASFESGKATIDTGVKAVTEVAKLGAAVASGGQTLAFTGMPGIPGGPEGGEDVIDQAEQNDLIEQAGKGLPDGTSSSWEDPNEYSYTSSTGDYDYYNEDDSNQDTIEAQQNNGAIGSPKDDNNELKDVNQLVLDNANIIINSGNLSAPNLNELETGNKGLDSEALNAQNKPNLGTQPQQSLDTDKNSPMPLDLLNNALFGGKLNGGRRRALGWSDRALEKIVDGKSFSLKGGPHLVDNKGRYEGMKNFLKSPDGQKAVLDARGAMHEFVDSLYMPGDASKDWQNNVALYNDNVINVMKERNMNDFVNSNSNVSKVIAEYRLTDKLDSKGNLVKSKEEQAKELLKGMEPYVNKGINDVSKIKLLQDRGQPVNDSIRDFAKEVRAMNNFMSNKNNMSGMYEIVRDRIPEERRGDREYILQTIKQEVELSKEYITTGAAKNPEQLKQLKDLEKKLDGLNIKGNSTTHKSDYVMEINRQVNEAAKKGSEKIKLNNPTKDSRVKQLEGIMNEELTARKNNSNTNKKKTNNGNS